MKTKNVKVRQSDIKQGATIYVAHPVYGIDKYLVQSKPYMVRDIDLFFNTIHIIKDGSEYEGKQSLHDAGIYDLSITKDSYNGRRAFFKLKHAEEWIRKWSKDKGFIKQHARHESFMNDPYDDWYYEYED